MCTSFRAPEFNYRLIILSKIHIYYLYRVGEQSAEEEDNDDIPVANRGNAGSPSASSNVSSVSKIQLPPINGAKNQAFEMPQDNGSLSKINIAPIPPINGSTNGAVMKQMEVEQNSRQGTRIIVISY